jgi:hypothetical protein
MNARDRVDPLLEAEFARMSARCPITPPVAPECADADPPASEAVENFAGLLAAAGLICLLITGA